MHIVAVDNEKWIELISSYVNGRHYLWLPISLPANSIQRQQ